MTESPFVKAEGPEPPDAVDLLGEKHRETMARLDATIRVELYRAEHELSRLSYRLTQETDKLNHVSNSLRISETKLFDSYQLIGQLVGFLDSIEWGTHDEWTRSQSLRERAHEYLTASNTIAT